MVKGAFNVPTLHVLEGPNKGRTYRTPHEPTLIGRQTDQVQLSDDSISRRHAEIRPVCDSWILLDLQSSNGTFLNGRRVVSPAPLRHGDQIKVGNSLLVFTGEDDVAGFGSVNDIPNLLDLEENGAAGESAILSAIDCAEQSVVLEAPQTADAVVGWNVICQVAETFGTGESIESSLERVADILFDRLIVDHLVLLTRRTGEEKLRPVVVRYRDKDGQTRPRISASRTIIDHVIKTKQGVLCANAMTDDRFSSENPQDSIHQLALGSVICVPVVVHRETYGVFHLDCSTSKHNYTPEQLRLVVAIGRLAGMAIENARLQESRMQTARLAATGETVAYLSHHIRNMLQGMQGGAEVVELGLKKRDLRVAGSGWGLVRRNLDRVYHLTLNMLTFSKDRQPRIELCQLNHIVEDALAMARIRAHEKGVELVADFEEMPPIPLDPEGVHQVAYNIVLNAIEAAPAKGGRVGIRTRCEIGDAYVTLTISDNGPGIPDAERAGLFDAFHSTKGQGGTGLGLAAAKKIVSELKGRIDVQSTSGEGCTFHVRLPVTHIQLANSDETHTPGSVQ